MADRNAVVAAPRTWMELADEANLMSEADRIAAFKAAFEANFKDVDINKPKAAAVDPDKCSAAGAGVYGGYAGIPTSFVLTVKDSGGRNIPNCGGQIVVMVVPGVGGSDIYGAVMDQGDGTYSVTYVVPTRGYYMVNVECNGFPIMGSPFPVFFGAGNSFSGLVPDPPEEVLLPGIAPVCREFLHGRCFKTDCNLEHPTHTLLMTAIEKASGSGTMSRVPKAPSAASMAAAQAILAAQTRRAHAAQQAQSQSSKDSTGVSQKEAEMVKRTVRVRNLVPNITAEQMILLFSVRNPVVECTITEPEHFAYIEYSEPEQARAALALNNLKVGGRPLNVEMAKSLPLKPPTS